MQTEIKIVEFEKYCRLCENNGLPETEDPCNECLTYPTNKNSHKPVNYKEKMISQR